MPPFQDVFENRVRFEETDLQGVVFYGNYVTYQDETFSAFIDAAGYGYDRLSKNEWDVHAVGVDLDFHAGATFGDELVHGMYAERFGDSSMSFAYQGRRAEDQVTVVSGSVTHVAVDESGEPTRVPDEFRDAIIGFQGRMSDGV
jgi:acyl-CoA thioester hydrolase